MNKGDLRTTTLPARRGRPPLSHAPRLEEQRRQFVELIAKGNTVTHACELLQMAYESYQRWVKDLPAFAEQVRVAKIKRETNALAVLGEKKVLRRNPEIARRLLSHYERETWKGERPEEEASAKGSLLQAGSITINIVTTPSRELDSATRQHLLGPVRVKEGSS